MRHRVVYRMFLLAVLLAPSCGGGSSPSAPAANPTPTPAPTATPAAATADLVISIVGDIGNMSYSPAAATLRVGQTVAWRNADTDLHTATEDSRRFNTATIARGVTSAPITMSAAGTFPYHCEFHPGMVGTLTITP